MENKSSFLFWPEVLFICFAWVFWLVECIGNTILSIFYLVIALLGCLYWLIKLIEAPADKSSADKARDLLYLGLFLECAVWLFFAQYVDGTSLVFLLILGIWQLVIIGMLGKYQHRKINMDKIYKFFNLKVFVWDVMIFLLAIPHGGGPLSVLEHLGISHPLAHYPTLLLALTQLYVLMYYVVKLRDRVKVESEAESNLLP